MSGNAVLNRCNDTSVQSIDHILPCPQGCQWQISLKHLPKHLQKECPYRCVFCSFCKMPIVYINLQNHIDDCDSIPIHCSFKCGHRAPRSQMKSHMKSCQNRPLDYDKQNAQPVIIQQGQNATNQLDLVLQLNLRQKLALEIEVADLKLSVENWKKKYSSLEKELIQTQLCQKTLFTVMEDSKEKNVIEGNQYNTSIEELTQNLKRIKSHIKTIDQDVVVTKENLYKRQNEQTTQLKKLKEYMDEALDSTNDAMGQITRIQSAEFNKTNEYLKQLENKEIHCAVNVWKIKKFSKMQHESKLSHTHKLTSMPFYTNEFGYKLCLELYPNGDASGDDMFLSLYLYIMKGGYDAILKWPVKYQARFILLDQLDGKMAYEKILYSQTDSQYVNRPSDRNLALGLSHFFPLAELQPRFLVNDTLFIKAIVCLNGDECSL